MSKVKRNPNWYWLDIDNCWYYDTKYKGFLYRSNGYQYLVFQDGRNFRRKILKINNTIAFSEWELISVDKPAKTG